MTAPGYKQTLAGLKTTSALHPGADLPGGVAEGPFLTHRRHGALPKEVKHWSLTTLREKLVKIGAKVFSHGRYVIFQMAEVAIPRDLLADILRRIDRLRPKPVST